jgi:zinc transport system permease protein
MISDLFTTPYLLRALIASVLVSAVAGYYGVFIVQRKLGFLASGLAHASFGGVALGILLSLPPLTVALPFAVLVAVAIKWVQDMGKLSSDTSIGIFFSVSMALGIIFLSLTKHYSTDAFSYLFGSILFIRWLDVAAAGVLLVMAVLSFPLWGSWGYSSIDSDLASVDGLKTKRNDYLLFVLMAITIVVSIKIVGIVLIGAFAVIPAAAARMVSRRLSTMTILSVLIGVIGSILGLLVSLQFNLPTGPAIILVQTVIFFVLLAFRKK